MRKKWLQAMGREDTNEDRIFVCQDHFDLPNDMVNYTQYCINGFVHSMVIKHGVLPSRFDCRKNKKEIVKEKLIPIRKVSDVKIPTRIKFISHRGTQTTEDLLDYQCDEELDPLAIPYQDNCWSSTYDDQTVIEEVLVKEENIEAEEEDYTNQTLIKQEIVVKEEIFEAEEEHYTNQTVTKQEIVANKEIIETEEEDYSNQTAIQEEIVVREENIKIEEEDYSH